MESRSLSTGGYDILKFVMSILVVAIHTHAFYGSFSLIRPITGIAVPVFFILSSYFYFRKLNHVGFSWSTLKSYLSRLGLMYMFWFFINLPIIYKTHGYFIDNGIVDIFRLIADVLLRFTFPGSWFLSGLALAIVMYSLVYNCRFMRYTLFLLSLFLLFYINCIDMIPDSFQGLYNWFSLKIRDEVRLTVLEALPWVGVGMLISDSCIIKIMVSNVTKTIIFCISICSLVMLVLNFNSISNIVSKLIASCSLVFIAGSFNIPITKTCIHLRNLSILFFMIHFIWNVILQILFSSFFNIAPSCYFGHLGYFFIVLFVTWLSSELYLLLATKKQCKLLNWGF